MSFIEMLFNVVLASCSLYAAILGGRTGRAGVVIFLTAAMLTYQAVQLRPGWSSTAINLFYVDLGCLVALFLLAIHSNRYWTIWALGFQSVAVATHIVTYLAPDFVPKSYQALISFISIPILAVMVWGTKLDWDNYHNS